MSLTFPNSPSTNDTHVTGGSTWIFNGEMWVRQGTRGAQGLQGLQGNQGVQGLQGLQGNQGTQGLQGLQGNQGVQGLQGLSNQGVQGNQGLQGRQGTQGLTGAFGGATFTYGFLTDTSNSDPGTGNVKFNNSNLSSATTLFIDDEDDNGTDIQSYLRTIDDSTSGIKGHFKIADLANPDDFALFTITASSTEQSGYFSVPISYISGSATSFSNGENLTVTFARTGDKGDTGIQGLQGLQGNQGVQGLQGLQGNQGVQGLQGLQGNQGVQGLQGNQGVQGLQGLQGNQGVQGLQGISNQGVQGLQGLQGLQGNQGTQGLQGTQGNQGTQGLQGNQGTQGLQGNQGVQGLSNQGTQGLQGLQGIHSRVAISTESPSPADVGDFWYDSDDSALFIYYDSDQDGTGDQWIEIGAGPTGAQGTQGTQGLQGLQGLQGNQGTQGLQGLQGNQGTQGLQGLQGNQGVQGTQGLQGLQGNQGTQGTQGLQGTQGTQGLQGNQGLQGLQGLQGNQGVQGLQGLQGNQGTQGLQGLQGNQGVQGLQGLQGTQGRQGTQGTQGLQGLQGNQGTQGTQGLQGLSNQGVQGLQGLQGNQGTQGLQGLQGNQGTQGLQGLQGNQGVQGLQGLSNQGVQGQQGLQGRQGTQGLTGAFGGATFSYDFNTDTSSSDPGAGKLKVNNSNLTSATLLLLDDVDENGTDIQAFLRTIDDSTSTIKGHVKVSSSVEPDDFVIYTISATSEQTGYHQVSVSYVSGSVTSFSNGQDLVATFARTGDKGDTGSQGTQGLSNQGVQGLQGLQGITARVAISTESPSPADVGDFWYDSDDSGLFIYYDSDQDGTGDQWIEIGAGPTGAQGIQGTQGLQGTQGRQGTQGTQGLQGLQGNQGTQGLQGNQGVQGTQGTQGTQGRQGLQGLQGNQGTQGTQGRQGTQGLQGLQGNQGTQGLQGLQGNQGTQGLQGLQGLQGNQGVQGTQGTQGRQGTQGLQGLQGLQGNQGVQGTQGTQGRQGTQGLQGLSNQGVQGLQGLQGNQGTQGLQGLSNQGVQGLQGLMGIQGHQGVQGHQGEDGNFGGATFYYFFSTSTTDSDPGQGALRFNNSNLSSATLMYIDDADHDGTDIQAFLRTIDDSTSTVKGHVRVSNKTSAGDFALFTISGTNTEATGYFKVSVSYLSGSTSFSNFEDLIVTFARTGTKGDTGDTGSQGVQGLQGILGTAGSSGSQGTTGTAGSNGSQGVQGTTGTAGSNGSQGTTGTAGSNGSQGTQGLQGLKGTTGDAGSQGTQGTVGSTGAQGTVGSDGTDGTNGNNGSQGVQGLKGTNGTSGTDGNDGAQGTAGSVTVSNNANNRVVTATGGDTANAEANLTFDGSLLTVNATNPNILIEGSGTSTGNYPTLRFNTGNNQGVMIEHNEFDGELPINGYGLIVTGDDDNTQFSSTGTLSFSVLGNIYAGGTSISGLSRVLTTADEGHGNGIDADTLDGVEGSSFLRSNADDTATGRLTLQRAFTSDTDYHLYIRQTTNGEGATIRFADDTNASQFGYFTYKHADSSSNGAGNSFHFNSSESSTAVIIDQTSGSSGFYVGTNEVWHGGNDGSGSGLDADTVDGIEASNFLRSNAADTATGLLTLSGGLIVDGSTDSGGSDYAGYRSDGTNIILKGDSSGRSAIFFQSEKNGTNINHASDYGYIQFHPYGIDGSSGESNKLVIGVANDSTDTLVLQSPYKNGVKISFKDATSGTGGTEYTVWHAGNDGSGSGLDADTLDGVQGSNYLRSNTNDTFTGQLTVSGNLLLSDQVRIGDDAWIEDYNSANSVRIKGNQDNNQGYIAFGQRTEKLGCNNSGTLEYSGNFSASGTVTASSDIKLKKNINTIDNALNKVLNLRGVEFDYIESGEHNIGVIAQEVEEVLPDLVHTNENTDTKSVAYGNLTAVLIEAVKELKKENDALSARIQSLEDR